MDKDVTHLVHTGMVDDEMTEVRQCVCGKEYETWEQSITMDRTDVSVMPCCGAKLYFRIHVNVFQMN